VAAALETIANLESTAAGQIVAELDSAASLLREARSESEPAIRSDLEKVTTIAIAISEQVTRLDEARVGADAATAATIDRLIAAIPRFLRAFYSREVLATATPELTSECEVPWAGASLEDDLEAFNDALAAVLDSPLAEDPQFAALIEWGTQVVEDAARPEPPMSELNEEFDRCSGDGIADKYGDNDGCDALHDACAERDLLACNDLYFASTVASAYEAFGATCGERAGFGDTAFAGHCEELDT
jgi:hypothetical protein